MDLEKLPLRARVSGLLSTGPGPRPSSSVRSGWTYSDISSARCILQLVSKGNFCHAWGVTRSPCCLALSLIACDLTKRAIMSTSMQIPQWL